MPPSAFVMLPKFFEWLVLCWWRARNIQTFSSRFFVLFFSYVILCGDGRAPCKCLSVDNQAVTTWGWIRVCWPNLMENRNETSVQRFKRYHYNHISQKIYMQPSTLLWWPWCIGNLARNQLGGCIQHILHLASAVSWKVAAQKLADGRIGESWEIKRFVSVSL